MKFRLALLPILVPLIIFILVFFVNPSSTYAATSPSLGQAASFAVLAGTAITNVPLSTITGDVGLSPASGSNYAGLTTGEVSGTIFAVDSAGPAGPGGNNPTLVNQAKTDLVTAYTALAAGANADANCDAAYVFGAGNKDLSGASLVPGVYCADTFTLTGTLTLSGSGVWVFRSAATLITSGTANVVGGDPCQVWWQVPSSATLGTTTSLIGNILALTSITMNTGASVNGRALARNGAVSLASNTINQSCSAFNTRVVGTSTASTGSTTSPIVCPVLSSSIIAPTIIEARRIDADSIFLSWSPYSGLDTFNIRYGPTNGNWIFNTDVTGFSTTINGLPPNQPFWFQVANRDSCAIGEYGPALLVGGTGSVGGSPRLPNTGIGPDTQNIPWGILGGILSFITLFLTCRALKFSLK